MRQRVVVVGGGVSGLTAAHYLVQAAPDGAAPEVTVLEATDRLGGKVGTDQIGGYPVDTGPDAMLIRAPAAAALVEELGLTPELRAPAGTGAYVWTRGRLRPLPAGSVFGVPDKLTPLLRSGLLGPTGFLRAGADLVMPQRVPTGDPTIEALLRPRFGRQVYQRLIEPMLGGVHAGQASRLSARSAVPEVMALAQAHRSLYLALRGRAPKGSGPALMTLEGGLQRLVTALRDSVGGASGARLMTGVRARALVRSQGGWDVLLEGAPNEPALTADHVVLATPAWEAARLLRPLDPAAAGALDAIDYVGVATVTFGFPTEQLSGRLRGTGFLVPPVEGRMLVGCSWLTAKWPHLNHGPLTLIRCMVGRDGDQRWADLDDDALVTAVRAELAAAMGLTAEPTTVTVRRMPRAMPQYTVGHADRLATVDAALAALPGLELTGAGYRGVGLAGCIAQARNVATRLTRTEADRHAAVVAAAPAGRGTRA